MSGSLRCGVRRRLRPSAVPKCGLMCALGTRGRRRTRQGLGLTQPEIGGEVAEELPQTESNIFLPGRLSPRELIDTTNRPPDLMSRRHPLFVDQSLQIFIQGSSDVPASSRRQFLKKRIYFFFLATLRVFFAVFFTALFAFFAFLAFLAMLPS